MMKPTVVIWSIFLAILCIPEPVSSATFTIIRIPLSISPLVDVPRPDKMDATINSAENIELYKKATIYDDWQLSVYDLDRILSDKIETVINDISVLRDRKFLNVSLLTVYDCKTWCHNVSISEVTRVTGKTMEMLKGQPTPITVLEMHNAVVQTMEDIYCFNMAQLEAKLGMKSTNVTEKEWALFVPEIVQAAIQCRADRLGVTKSELAELLRVTLATFDSYRLDDLSNIFFPNFDNLVARKNLFETRSFDGALNGMTSAQGQEKTVLYFANDIANFNIRDLEILYDWGKPQLFAIQNIPLSSYMSDCSIVTADSFFDMSKALFGHGSTLPSCNVAYVLSRSLNEVQNKFNNLAEIEDRNALYIFLNATGITSWFQMDNILQLNVDEGIWVEIPYVTHVASANGNNDTYIRTCSVPQVIASIKSLNQSATLLTALATNNPSYRNLLLSTYGYSKNELINVTGQSLPQIDGLSVAGLHALLLGELMQRYNFTNLASIVGIAGVDQFVISTLPSFEWSRIVRAVVQGSFTVAADALSVNVASSNSGLRVVNQADGNPSVQVSPGSDYLSRRITEDSLATCLLERNKADILSMPLTDYHKLFKENIVPIVNGKITIETQTLSSLLAKDGLTLAGIENKTVAEVISEETGLSVQQLGCLYGWDSAFLSLINEITWGNVSAFRICSEYQASTLHSILVTLSTSQPKNCFGYITLTPATYNVLESVGFVDVSLELVGGVAVDSTVEVRLSVIPSTASVGKDFETMTDVTIRYNVGETGKKSVRVNISNDAIVENDEKFFVAIASSDSNTKVVNSLATVTIVDDDFVSVSFEVDPSVVKENVGNITADVVLSGEIERDITVSWSIKDSTTTSSDYQAVTGSTITFQPGGVKKIPILIKITDDTIVEDVELFTLQLTTSDTHVNTSESAILITDNDRLFVSFVSSTYDVKESESDSQVLLGVRAIGISTTSVFVSLVTFNDDAIAGADYVAVSQTITFSPSSTGTQTINVPVTISPDVFIEPPETFTATLSGVDTGGNLDRVTIGSPSSTTVTIEDDDKATVNFKSATYSVPEGKGYVTIDVTLSGELRKLVTVGYATAPDTATTSDFTSTSRSIEFKSGDPLEKSFNVSILNDKFVEASEEFVVGLTSSDSQVVIGSQGRTTVTITDDDDVLVEHVQTTYSFPENIGVGVLGVRLLNMSGPLQTNVTVSVNALPTSATETLDYTKPSSSLSFNVGDFNTVRNILIPIKNDTIFETSESLFVVLANDLDSKVVIKDPATASVTITDNDNAIIEFSPRTYSVSEGEKVQVQIRVTSGQLGATVTIGVSTSLSTAEADDFIGVTTSVTFSPGETGPKTVEITTSEDDVVEPTETLTVALSSSSSVTLGQAATVSILDDDDITVSFGASTYQVTEGDPTVSLQVFAVGKTTIPLSVSVTTKDSTAKASTDYQSTTQIVTFNQSDTSKQVTVNIIDNDRIESAETFIALLTSTDTTRVKLGAVNSTKIEITDDDFATVEFSSNLFTGNETVGYAEINIMLSGILENNVVVRVSTSGGTATAGVDYGSLSNYELIFRPGEAKLQSIRINVTNDDLIEGIERFTASLTSPSSFTRIGSVNVTTIRIVDDDVATISFVNAPSVEVAEGQPVALNVEVAGPLNTDVTATATVMSSSATVNSDYQVISPTTLTFEPGKATSTIIFITTGNDSIVETDETFTVILSTTSDRVRINDGVMIVTIKDDDKAKITLSSDSYSGSEALPSVVVFLSVTGQLETTVTARLSLSSATASSTDYEALANSVVTFSPTGPTSQNRTITIVDDDFVESPETFRITADPVGSNVEISPTSTADIIITDNDTAQIGFASLTYDVEEDDGTANVTVELITPFALQRPVVFRFSTLNGTAISPGDFAETDGQQQFNIDETNGATRTIKIGINDDIIIENAENFQVKLTVISGDTLTSAGSTTVTIKDTDVPSIRFLEGTKSVTENGKDVTVHAILTGTLDRQVTARVKTSDISAVANHDYQPADQEITFSPNAPLQEFKINISEDALIEGSETFRVTLTSDDAQVDSPGSVTVTILDNDRLKVGFSTPTLSVPENGNFAFASITLTGTLVVPVNVTVHATDKTAFNNFDYRYNMTTLTIDPSQTSPLIVPVSIMNDSLVENNEQFTVTLTENSNLVDLENAVLTITIEDNDRATIRFSSISYNIKENQGQVTVDIECTSGLQTTVFPRVTSVDATAVAGTDYMAISQQIVSFSPGDTKKTLTVSILDDDAVENVETLTLYLSTGGNSNLLIGSPNVTTIQIEDEDVAYVKLERSTYSVDEGANSVEVKAILTAIDATQRPLSFLISTENGTALSPNDYTSLNNVGTFSSASANGASITFLIAVSDDNIVENTENFYAKLSTIDTNLQLLSPNKSMIDIKDNDAFQAALKEGDFSIKEEDASATVTVELTGKHERNVEITLVTIPVTATENQDYVPVATNLLFGPGVSSRTVTITIRDDTTVEETETFQVLISSTDPQVNIRSPERITISITNTDKALVSFNQTKYNVKEGVGSSNVWVVLKNILQVNSSVSVNVYVIPNTAKTPSDFTVSSTKMVMTFHGGQTQILPVSFNVVDDNEVEDEETLYAFLEANDNVGTVEPWSIVHIEDNDVAIVGFSKALYTVNEHQTAVVEIVLTNTLAVPVTVSAKTSVGTAAASDFSGIVKEDITFNPGDTKKTLSISLNNDGTVENDESFTVTLETTHPRVVFNRTQTTVMITDDDAMTVMFEKPLYIVSEDDSIATLVVVASGSTSINLPIGIVVQPGSAKSGSDYGSVSSVSLTPGVSRYDVRIDLVNDKNIENNETFTVQLGTLGNPDINLGAIGTTTVLILDDDAATVEFTQELYSVNEDTSFVNVTLNLTGILDQPATVRVSSSDGSATAGQDYSAIVNKEITFSPGDPTIQYIRINITNDLLLEGTESFVLAVSSLNANVRIGKAANTTVRILDDDVVSAAFEQDTATVDEFSPSIQVFVEITGSRSRPVSVNVSSSDISAGAGKDYTSLSDHTLTFQPSESRKSVTVDITGDTKVEFDETFRLILTSDDTNVKINDDRMTITIRDNDVAAVRFESATRQVGENITSFTVGVLLSGDIEIPVSAQVTVSPETAATSDYSSPPGPLNFLPGDTKKDVTFFIDNDVIVESTETFLAKLSPVGSKVTLGSPNECRISIIDDDAAQVRFENSTYFVSEDAGFVNLTVVLISAKALERDVKVSLSTETGTARSPGDFSNIISDVVFRKGENNGSQKFVIVTLNNDQIVESNEDFKVKLSFVDHGLMPVNPSTATVTVVDNDSAELSFTPTTYSITEGKGPVSLVVLLTGTIERSVSARITTIPGTAGAEDFVSIVNQQITFNPGGRAFQTVPVTIDDDEIVEGVQEFSVVLVKESGVDIKPGGETATISITDDDEVTVSLEAASSSYPESSDFALVLVKASGQRQKNITVNVTTFDRTASATSDDYDAKTELVTIPANLLQVPFNVKIEEDTLVENTEQFGVRVTSTDPQVNIPVPTLSVSITDNDRLTLTIGEPSYRISENAGVLLVSVTASGSTAVEISGSKLETSDDTAKSPSDYTSKVESLVFQPGDTKKDIAIVIGRDGTIEGDEDFLLRLTSTNAAQITIGTPSVSTVTILDDDAIIVSFEKPNYIVSEDDGTIKIGVVVNGSTALSLNVGIMGEDSSANVTIDYTLSTTTLQLAPGVSRLEINISIVDDLKLENNETFSLVLNNLGDTRVRVGGMGRTNILIVDDDAATIQFTESLYRVDENNLSVNVTLNMTGILDEPATVRVYSVDGSAVAGSDYTGITNQEVTFTPNGPMSQTVTVQIKNDVLLEGTESFYLVLTSSYTNIKIGTIDNTTIRIVDDDAASVEFQKTTETVNEAERSLLVYVEVTGNRSVPVVVKIESVNVFARSPDDYTLESSSLKFEPSDTEPKPVIVLISGDQRIEDDEIFGLRLSTDTPGVKVGDNFITITIKDDDDATIRMESAERQVNETFSNFTLGVLLTGDNEISISARVTFSPGTADSTDYVLLNDLVTFNPGIKTQEVSFYVVNDDLVEATEMFTATLAGIGSKVKVASPEETKVYIKDDDSASVRFENTTYSVNEDEKTANLTAILLTTKPLQRDVSVRYSTENSSAVSPGDFSAITSFLTFKKGEGMGMRKQVIIPVNDDPIVETTEEFDVKLSSSDSGLIPVNPSTASVSIFDNDKASVGFVQTAFEVLENKGPATVSVYLIGQIARPVTARFVTLESSAKAGNDYTFTFQDITFSPNDKGVKNVDVPIQDDKKIEGDETFSANLSPVNGVDIISGRGTSTITIADNDVVSVTLEVIPSTVLENAKNVSVRITATGLLEKTISLNVRTLDATASAPSDYGGMTQTITLDSSTTSKSFIITINDDKVVENTETFRLNITSTDPQVNITSETAMITIQDDDKLTLQFNESVYTVAENGGKVSVSVIATGSTAIPISGSVITTEDGSATSPSDYTALAEDLVFLPGQVNKDFNITIIPDQVTEGPENFLVKLTSTNNARIILGAQFSSVVLITDDDTASVQFLNSQYSVNESLQFVDVSVSLTGSLGQPAQISVNTRDDEATGGSDYGTLSNYQLTFTPGGSPVQTIRLNITDDKLVEGPEDFIVILSSVSPLLRIGNIGETTIRIIDNDVAGIVFESTTLNINEDAGVTSIAVVATGGLKTPVTVTVNVVGETAASTDFLVTPTSITMTFEPNGATRQFFNVTPVDDPIVESDETITATLSTTDPSAVILTREMQITIEDNDKARVNLTQQGFDVKEGDDSSITVHIDLIGTLAIPVTVNLRTANNTAKAGDYSAINRAETFSPGGPKRKSIVIAISDDDRVEQPEVFNIILSTSDDNVEVVDPKEAAVFIRDNDGASLHFQSPRYPAFENQTNVTLTVVLATNFSLERPATASFSLRNGTAVYPEDFPATIASSVTFAVGDDNGKTKDVVIPIMDDNIVEPTQSFYVQIVSQENIINPGMAEVYILDDDVVTVNFSSVDYYGSEDVASAEVVVTVNYAEPLQRPISITLNTSDNTAKAGEDYESVSSAFTISQSDGREKQFPITIKNDGSFEDEESFKVQLSSTDTSVTVISPSSANVFITDNDNPEVRFTRDHYYTSEDNKLLQICVETSTVLRDDIVVRVTSSPQTAGSPLDFDAVSQAITLTSTTPICFDITIKDDNIIEGNETFRIFLSSSNPRVTFPNRNAFVTIIDDDANECIDKTHDCDQNAFCTDTEDSFNCTCNAGFTGDGKTCSNINECELNKTICHENATCVDTIGSFNCTCKPGYTGDGVNFCDDLIECNPNPKSWPCHRYSRCRDTAGSYICFCPPGFDGDGYNFCNDTNECLLGQDNCHANFSTCHDILGSFTCQCKDGFTGDGVICDDIDECKTGTHNCDSNAMCNNTVGSFTCTCKTGFTLNGRSCTDINECSSSVCDPNANCTNIPGSYYCKCGTGLTGNGTTCEDIDECLGKPCHPNATCNNTFGSYGCDCNQGYSGDGNVSCTDDDECRAGAHNCHHNATCRNMEGSFQCTCNEGFTGDGVICTNINECLKNVCDVNAVCNDTLGSYTCQCKVGYTGNGTHCEDLLECIPTNFDYPCHRRASCVDIPGSFLCTCRDGYTGDGFLCSDNDECNLKTDNCNENANCTNTQGSFKCTCKDGFTGDGVKCQDVNECEPSSPCDGNATCVNTVGSYNCTCDKGFTSYGAACHDIDECKGTHDCNVLASCNNTVGSYTCQCKSGFTGNGKQCDDYDECDLKIDNCNENANCTNTQGSFNCTCKDGFTGDGVNCRDIDECKGTHECNASATCNNTEGSYTCQCKSGFTGNGKQCDDIDECKDPTSCPNAKCSNSMGGYSCTCKEGFESVGGTCKDIDECKDPDICPANSTCKNSEGLFSCVCIAGYEFSGPNCVDINECASPSACHIHATCTNTNGSYICTCKSGFTGVNNQECEDIDECAKPNDCHINATCTNTNGSYICTCKSGFTGVDGQQCEDILECNGANSCHDNATCNEQIGSYSCTCNEGYTGNGIQCEDIRECDGIHSCHVNANCIEQSGSHTCECKNGYTGNGTYCEDMNECAGPHSCDVNAVCNNTDGSYICTCNSGFTGDGRQCQDIKECSIADICHVHATCNEEIGSYKCTCNPGYTGNSTHCEDINECAQNGRCHPEAVCKNTPGSFTCTCKPGFTGTGTQCQDLNECNETPQLCSSPRTCENLYASYRCNCPWGQYYMDGQCKNVLVFNLEFTILEGAPYSDNLLDESSEQYLKLKRDLENSVNAAYKNSTISKNYLQSRLQSFRDGTSGKTVANFSVFIEWEVSNLSTPLVGQYFIDQLKTVSNKKILEPNYVLYKTDSVPAAQAGDYDECSFSPSVCKSDEMCVNYPGTYRCYCSSPRHLKVNDVCTEIITTQSGITILNLPFTEELNDPMSLQFLQLAEAIEFQLNRYFRGIYGDSFQGTRVINMSPGSVVVSFLIFTKPNMDPTQNGTVSTQLLNALPTNATGKFMQNYQVKDEPTQDRGYNECDPPNYVHIADCDVNAMCTDMNKTYGCTCNDSYYGDGYTCTAKPQMGDPPVADDDMWWVVYAIVFGVTFLVLCMFILIVCCLEHAEESRYQVEDSRLVGEKNKYFFNGESMGIVNPDIEMSSRNGGKDVYTTTRPRMESYKVNPMFDNKTMDDRYYVETKTTTSNDQEEHFGY